MSFPILVVGSVAFDDIETPHGRRERCLGGSANYFSCAASNFAPCRLVAVVGEAFPKDHLEAMEARRLDLGGLEIVEGGKSFFWRGRYPGGSADAVTIETQLNVFEHFDPKIPEEWRDTSEAVVELTKWSRPVIPGPGDPAPYSGTPIDS